MSSLVKPVPNVANVKIVAIVISAPSGIPGSISFIDVNLTQITIQWTELPCEEHNGPVAGYIVKYSSATVPPHTDTLTVSGSDTTELTVSDLLSHTTYTFSVGAMGAPQFATSSVTTTYLPG